MSNIPFFVTPFQASTVPADYYEKNYFIISENSKRGVYIFAPKGELVLIDQKGNTRGRISLEEASAERIYEVLASDLGLNACFLTELGAIPSYEECKPEIEIMLSKIQDYKNNL